MMVLFSEVLEAFDFILCALPILCIPIFWLLSGLSMPILRWLSILHSKSLALSTLLINFLALSSLGIASRSLPRLARNEFLPKSTFLAPPIKDLVGRSSSSPALALLALEMKLFPRDNPPDGGISRPLGLFFRIEFRAKSMFFASPKDFVGKSSSPS
jgi:hypothetical protein